MAVDIVSATALFQSVSRSMLHRREKVPSRAPWIESPIEEDRTAKVHQTSSKKSSRANRLLKAKQGLVGFANGSKIAAMADTGSRKNVMSESYAKQRGLTIERSPSTFEIGNSKKIQSTGRNRPRGIQ